MSAIGGILRVDGAPVSKETLEGMRDIVDYLGPDGSGIWFRGKIGLVHRLLANSPESLNEKQPLSNGRGLWITADCRIDNREELSGRLSIPPSQARDLPDTAYLLLAYEAWGEQTPAQLLGDFAFAIWDECRQTLFSCRDPIGIKPFVYAWDGRSFIFGSQIKQIFQDPEVSDRLNLSHLAGRLMISLSNREETPYEAIRRLPPGYSLIVKNGCLVPRKYWDWEPEGGPLSCSSMEENAQIFRHLFTEAVRARLRTPKGRRVGSFLSGGLDSSSVAGVAASIFGPSFPVFTLLFPEADTRYQRSHKDPVDEIAYAEEVIKKHSLESHPIEIKGLGPFENYETMAWQQEVPLNFPTLTFFDHAFKRIEEKKCLALLYGEGGDELFYWGPQFLPTLLKKGHLLEFSKEWLGRHKNLGTSHAQFLSSTIRSLFPLSLRFFYHDRFNKTAPDWIDPDFAKKISLKNRLSESFKRSLSFELSASYGILIWLREGYSVFTLEMINRAAAASRIEPRYPFLDVRLLRFMSQVPWFQKSSGGVTKRLLRESLKGLLPVKVRERLRKTEFTPVIRASFERYAQKELREIFENPHPALRLMTTPEKVKVLAQYCLPPHAGRPFKDLFSFRSLWYLMSVDQWLKQHENFLKRARGRGLMVQKNDPHVHFKKNHKTDKKQKEYSSLRLIKYGSLKELTKAGGAAAADGTGFAVT